MIGGPALLAALTLAVAAAGAEDAPMSYVHERYLTVKGGAWRLAHADLGGDGRGELVCGTWDGAVRCAQPNTGELVWEADVGSFPFGIAADDVNGDGRDEVFAATAGGDLRALASDGGSLWTFSSGLPLYNVATGRLTGDDKRYIVCGGIGRKVHVLDPDGHPVAEFGVRQLVHRLAVGDVDADGADEVFVVDARNRGILLKLEKGELRVVWDRPLRVPDDMRNWENPGAFFFAFSVDIGDIDGDGAGEIVMGDTFFNRQAVMALDGSGEPLWISDREPWGRPGYEFYSTAFVRVVDALPGAGGPGVLAVLGGTAKLLDAQGQEVGRAVAPVGFADLLFADGMLYLGSSPNGDDTVYRVPFGESWDAGVAALARYGTARRVGENLARLREQVLAHPAEGSGLGRQCYVKMLSIRPAKRQLRNYRRAADWLREQFPYGGLRFVANMKVIEPTPPLNSDGEPWSMQRWRTDSINGTMTVEEIIAAARWVEENEVPTLFLIGHSCMPFITLETAEKMLQAAPNFLVGFVSAEDEQIERIPRYFAEYFGPLADLCVKYGGKKCITVNKNVWWMTAPSMRPVFDALFTGERRRVVVAATEDSNSRTPEINALARFGLRQAGLLEHNQVSLISDLFSFCRFHQWEYPKHGHPYLRLLCAHTLLGGTDYASRIAAVNWGGGPAFTQMGHESLEIFFHMLGKGLIFTPEPEQIAGLSPVGIAVHQPPDKWLRDGHNGHAPQIWEDDPELHNAVIPHNGCLWGNTPTPEHALQYVLLGKERQFGCQIPATPYGPFVIVPAHADLDAVPGVDEWWHTDGISVWRDGGPRLTGQDAADALRRSFEDGVACLPVRAEGHVFCQTLRLADGRYRVYLIDPGWLDPTDRDVTVRLQAEGEPAVSDVLTGEDLTVEDGCFRLTVPAGSLRIIDVTIR
jgi:outer membrane protein assembly factor BamB